jgi:hypothetical protein
MSPVKKLFLLGLLFSLLSFLPLSASEFDTEFDFENKTSPRLNSIPSSIIEDFLVNDDTGSADQSYPTIAVNSSGNFTISWQDDRNGNLDIYLQRYDSSGAPLGPNIKVNDDTGSRWQEFPAVSANGGGDLVLTWNDTREAGWDIYAQRYNSSGIPLDSNFKVNRTGFSWRWFPAIALDESGNFVIVWNDDLNTNYNDDIYAQRYDSEGIPSGANFKVNDDTGISYQLYSAITLDGSGGFIITWTDLRNGDPDVYAQRYDFAGTSLGSNFRVNDDDGSVYVYQGMSAIASDALGNFIITWVDDRNGNDDIFAQRYTSAGALIGSNFQVNDDTGKSGQGNPAIAIEASGNAIITWNDSRNGNYDVYAQRFNSSGSKMGTNFLVNNSQSRIYGQILPTVAATSSNIYFAWEDDRRGKGWDIYAKVVDWNWTKVGEDENVAIPNSFELSQNYPNPFNPTTTIPFQVGGSRFVVHSPIHTTLKIYNILGQLVRTLVNEEKTSGTYNVIWDGKDDSGKEVSSGIYFYQLKTEDYTFTKKMVLLR